MSRYCGKCGNKIKENELFCSKCGNKINKENEEQLFCAKQTENKVAPHIGSIPPKRIPTAIPVKAPCPKESAKNDILLLTTIVLRSPNKGVIIKIAIKAFFIKV